MQALLPILIAVALLASGIAAGVLLWSVMGGVPLLLSLPADTVVRTGHGDDTTIAAETSNIS